jgi:hypothetical protein
VHELEVVVVAIEELDRRPVPAVGTAVADAERERGEGGQRAGDRECEPYAVAQAA